MHPPHRVPVLYLAPWLDYGGTGKGTLDWFRMLDRERYAPSLALTQEPSENRLLAEVVPFAEEVWNLPELMPGDEMPSFIADFVYSRGVRVVHIMNARLGFELLPDLALLPEPPAIVVQLHVEEDTRGGYVRYVTTRYGNLVDAFSVSSRHLADTIVADYDVTPAKCRVIYTGVDADGEFCPTDAEPAIADPGNGMRILYLGRLVEQKDPLLMIDVVDRLRRVEDRFHVDVVGYGPMEHRMHTAIAQRGLESHVTLHGPTAHPASWYAGADLLLLTSVYEGIPYVLFEALSMQVPAVAPSLPGTRELIDQTCGRLIDPRDDVDAYVGAIAGLVGDPGLRESLGRAGRARMRAGYSLARMGAEHGALYAELVAAHAGRAARPGMTL